MPSASAVHRRQVFSSRAMTTNGGNEAAIDEIECEACARRLHELRRQAMKYLMMEIQKMVIFRCEVLPIETLFALVFQQLRLPADHQEGIFNGHCDICHTKMDVLFRQAVSTLNTVSIAPYLPRLVDSRSGNGAEDQKASFPEELNRGNCRDVVTLLQENGSAVASVKAGSVVASTVKMSGNQLPPRSSSTDSHAVDGRHRARQDDNPAAALFFARAAQKLNITNKKKGRGEKSGLDYAEEHDGSDQLFETNFSGLLDECPPDNPPGLFKYAGRRVDGKVKVLLRIVNGAAADSKREGARHGCLLVDQRRKQVNVYEPTCASAGDNTFNTARYQSVPKLFAFDAIFEPETPQCKVSASSVLDVLHAVINGGDGCLVAFGAGGLGKTHTMVGHDDSAQSLGAIPCALSWLYNLIEDKKQRTGTRFSVRISAVEIVGASENLRDLLVEQASGASSSESSGASPGIYLRDDPVGGLQITNVSELRAATAEKAAFFLDAAMATRTSAPTNSDASGVSERQGSHMLFTIHVYQHRIDRSGSGQFDGGRSRLHLFDLSALPRGFNRDDTSKTAPSHSSLGNVIVTLLNGLKHFGNRHSKITRLLRDSLGKNTCRTTLIAHVSGDEKLYSETMATIQLVSRVQRSRRRKTKGSIPGTPGGSFFSATASSSGGENSCEEDRFRPSCPRPAHVLTCGIDDSANESGNESCSRVGVRGYPSSAGEESCDTVIYCGPNGELSDRDLTDNEGPPPDHDPLRTAMEQLRRCDAELEESAKEEELTAGSTSQEQLLISLDEEPRRRFPVPRETPPTTLATETKACVQDEAVAVIDTVSPKTMGERNSTKDSNIKNNRRTSNLPAAVRHMTTPSIEEDEYGYSEMGPVTEKELRRKERRIAKLLKQKNDVFDVNGNLTSNRSGYRSECEAEYSRLKTRKAHSEVTDGYTSAPETEPRLERLDIKLRKEVMRDMQSIRALDEEPGSQSSGRRLSAIFTQRLLSNFVTQQLVEDRRKSQVFSADDEALALLTSNECRPGGEAIAEPNDCLNEVKSSLPSLTSDAIGSSRKMRSQSEVSTSSSTRDHSNASCDRSRSCSEHSCDSLDGSSSGACEPYSLYTVDGSRRRRGPPKVTYRWSTLLEEGETRHCHAATKQKKDGRTNAPDDLKRCVSPKTRPRKISPSVTMDTRPHIHNSRSSVSGCSDTSSSSGIVSNGSSSPSQQSLHGILPPASFFPDHHGNERRHRAMTAPSPKSSRRWFFGRERKPKARVVSGYVSEGSASDVHRSSWRRSRFFGSKSKLNSTSGSCSGYESTRTDGGLSSMSGNDSSGECDGLTKRKKKRFLGFRRRSLSDLSQKGRSRRSYWIDTGTRYQDDDSTQYQVYEIEDAGAIARKQKQQRERLTTSEGCIPFKVNPVLVQMHRKKIAELERQKERLAKEVNTAMDKLMLDKERCHVANPRVDDPDDPKYAKELAREVSLFSRRLEVLKCHLQVVTCFDKPKQGRSTTI